MKFKRPAGKPAWTADWFLWFYSQLVMPNGMPVVVEPFTDKIVREVFAEGRVELLVLLPKGNGKTAMMAALAVWHLLVTPNANTFIGAATKIQADEMFRFISHYVESEPEIAERLLLRKSTRELRSMRDQGFLRVLASDDSKQGGKSQGYNPTLALIDELHAHEGDSLYTDMRSGLFKNRGVLVTITTAGWDQESVLGKLREGFLSADQHGGTIERPTGDDRLTVARIGHNVMLEWANRPDEDYWNPEVAKLANPASWVTVESLQDAMDAPGITPWAYARYRANVWTLTYESWLPAGSWEALKEDNASLVPGKPTVAALDMARYKDAAALVLVQPREDGRKAVEALIWRPGGTDDPVPYSVVREAILEAHDTYDLRAVGYDPMFAEQLAEELDAEGVAMEKFPQTNPRMCPAWAELRKDILDGAFVHDGDPLLTSHMYAGTIREIGADQFRVVKAKGNGPDMDASEALAMANVLSKYEPEPEPMIEVFA